MRRTRRSTRRRFEPESDDELPVFNPPQDEALTVRTRAQARHEATFRRDYFGEEVSETISIVSQAPQQEFAEEDPRSARRGRKRARDEDDDDDDEDYDYEASASSSSSSISTDVVVDEVDIRRRSTPSPPILVPVVQLERIPFPVRRSDPPLLERAVPEPMMEDEDEAQGQRQGQNQGQLRGQDEGQSQDQRQGQGHDPLGAQRPVPTPASAAVPASPNLLDIGVNDECLLNFLLQPISPAKPIAGCSRQVQVIKPQPQYAQPGCIRQIPVFKPQQQQQQAPRGSCRQFPAKRQKTLPPPPGQVQGPGLGQGHHQDESVGRFDLQELRRGLEVGEDQGRGLGGQFDHDHGQPQPPQSQPQPQGQGQAQSQTRAFPSPNPHQLYQSPDFPNPLFYEYPPYYPTNWPFNHNFNPVPGPGFNPSASDATSACNLPPPPTGDQAPAHCASSASAAASTISSAFPPPPLGSQTDASAAAINSALPPMPPPPLGSQTGASAAASTSAPPPMPPPSQPEMSYEEKRMIFMKAFGSIRRLSQEMASAPQLRECLIPLQATADDLMREFRRATAQFFQENGMDFGKNGLQRPK